MCSAIFLFCRNITVIQAPDNLAVKHLHIGFSKSTLHIIPHLYFAFLAFQAQSFCFILPSWSLLTKAAPLAVQIWGYGYHLLSSVTTKTHSSSESISAAVLSSPTRVPGTHRCQHSHTRFIPVSPCQVRVIVLMECHSLYANIQCDLVWFITLWWMHKVCVCQTSRKETAAGVIVYCHAAYFSYFFPSLLPPSQPLFSTSFFRLSLFPVSYAAKNIVCVFCSRMGCWPSPVIFILVCYWGTRRAKVAVCSAYVFTFSVIHNHSVFFVVVFSALSLPTSYQRNQLLYAWSYHWKTSRVPW